jgi:hypothetical protein
MAAARSLPLSIWEVAMKRFCLGIIVAICLTLPAFANPPQLNED